MKKTTITTIAVAVTLSVMALLILINDIVVAIRLNELRANLQQFDKSEGNIDHIGLVATYEIHKKLFEKRITQGSADAIEQEINSLLIHERKEGPQFNSLYGILSIPALKVINFNRYILGKMPLKYRRSDESDYIEMDLAYYYERNFNFKRAIELYDRSLANKNLTENIRASILLHQGYCYALAGLEDKARENYMTILEKYGRQSSAITATILLRYLEGFSIAQKSILASKDDPLMRSQDLVNLLAYKQALTILESAERTAKPEDLPQITYYKARCFGGLGDTEKAVVNYLRVITSYPTSQYASFSNRKLYITGATQGDKHIMKISTDLNKRFNDPVLDRMIKTTRNIDAVPDMKQELVKIDLSSELLDKVDTVISEKKEPEQPKTKFLVIYTRDGNTYKGKLIEQTMDYVALETSIGRINVKRDRIRKIAEK